MADGRSRSAEAPVLEILGEGACTFGIAEIDLPGHRPGLKIDRVEAAVVPSKICQDGAVAVVDSMVTAIENELGEKVNTVATGGFAHLIIPKCATVDKINTHLTLEGLNYIWQMNNEKKGDK